MDHTVIRTSAVNHRHNNLSRSFNDLNCGQELCTLKPSLASHSGNAKQKCASFPSIMLPKISSLHGKDELHSIPVQLQFSPGFPRLDTIKYATWTDNERVKSSQTLRPKSCTARVHSPASSPQKTPERLQRNRMMRPRQSLPLAVEVDQVHSAPSSPTLMRKPLHVSSSQPVSFSKMVVEETDSVDRRRKNQDVTVGSCSTRPMSPALLRKFEDSDKTVRKAKNLIDDYKRSKLVHHNRQQEDGKSLAEAMEEVKNCRYLRVVKRKDDIIKEKTGD